MENISNLIIYHCVNGSVPTTCEVPRVLDTNCRVLRQVLHVVSTGGRSGSVLSKAPSVVVPDFSTVVREDTSPRTDTLKRGVQPGIMTTVRLAARTVSWLQLLCAILTGDTWRAI